MISLKKIVVNKYGKTILSVPELSINKGEVLGLIGPNGAGKSTLLKTMALLEEKAEGEMKVKNNVISMANPSLCQRRLFAFVFQHPLMLDTTVYNNVATGLRIRGIPKKETRDRVYEWLGKLDIMHLEKRHARTLSGGESQRVALARALVTNPEILFLDEPFSALDLPTKRALLADIKTILSELGVTTVFISHDYQEIKYLCHDVVLLYQGKHVGRYNIDALKKMKFEPSLNQFIKEWHTPLLEGYY